MDLSSLPQNIQIKICSHLDYKDLKNLSKASFTITPNFWRYLIGNRFPDEMIPEEINPERYFKLLTSRFNIKIKFHTIRMQNLDLLLPKYTRSMDVNEFQLQAVLEAYKLAIMLITTRYSLLVDVIKEDKSYFITSYHGFQKLRDDYNLPRNMHGQENYIIQVTAFSIMFDITFDKKRGNLLLIFISALAKFLDPEAYVKISIIQGLLNRTWSLQISHETGDYQLEKISAKLDGISNDEYWNYPLF
jgi:hypothetical protein